MNELGQALKIIFEKLAAFFDIFDLSFFVSGAVALGAIVFWLHKKGFSDLPVERWLKVSIFILGSYAGGLICFAAARFIRQTLIIPLFIRAARSIHKKLFEKQKELKLFGRKVKLIERPFDDQLPAILDAHGLSQTTAIQDYLQRTRSEGEWRLYIRFWGELRNAPEMALPLSFLNRYWVMAATYDGVAFALIVWFIVFAHCLDFNLETVALLIIVAFMSVVCFHEASRYIHHQRENLVATITEKRAKE
jgi:hypothetical protein